MPRYLGQHFLKDKNVLLTIADTIGDLYKKTESSTLLEIGPGKGALTKYIKEIADDFQVIEKDEKMKLKLLESEVISEDQIVMTDVLKRDYNSRYAKKGEPNHIVCGNLPYYITSPIMRMFFEKETRASAGVFLIQKEVADKIKYNADKKSYLWRLLNNHYHVNYIKTVSAKAFSPPPKVKSAIISLTKKEQPEYKERTKLLQVLDYLSPYKRKTLGKIQKMIGKEKMSIPASLHNTRTENLDWYTMAQIEVM